MCFDALTTAAVAGELRLTIAGGRAQRVFHPDELAVAFELYAQGVRRWLYCSTHPERARVHLLAERPARASDDVTPLLLLLRKYVDGARLEAIEAPPLERIIRFRFAGRLLDGEPAATTLVVEAMGRWGNLILLDAEEHILDAVKRIGPAPAEASDRDGRPVAGHSSRSVKLPAARSVRPVQPRQHYEPPPVPAKLDPRRLDPGALRTAVQTGGAGRPAAAALVDAVGACSPLLAREVVFAAAGDARATVSDVDWMRVAAALGAVWAASERNEWAPTVAYEGDRLVAFAPYQLRSFGDVQPAQSISAAVEAWYARVAPARAAEAADAARKRTLRLALAAAQDRWRAKRFSLRRSLVPEVEVARWREMGEELLGAAGGVVPGQGEARVIRPDGSELVISLDTARSAVENAQRYFARYKKLKAAALDVPAMLAATEHQLAYLDEALTHLELARTPDDVAALRDEWASLGYVSPKAVGGRGIGAARGALRGKKGALPARRGAAPRASSPTGVRRLTVDGFEVWIGRSGTGNDAVIGPERHPGDLWLHARGVRGAHVLIRNRGRPVPESTLRQVAAIAAARSQARAAGTVAVDYTSRRQVERIKGAPPGLVTYRGERTLHVAPATARM